MVLSRKIGVATGLLFLALTMSSSVFAQRPSVIIADAGLDDSVSQIRGTTGGRVLSAETRSIDGREVHYIRILSRDGKVSRFRLDAETGRQIPKKKRRR